MFIEQTDDAAELARLDALHRYDILDTPPEQSFEDLTRLASTIVGTPTALVTFVDSNRQWFKSRLGFPPEQTDRSVSFCSHVILGDDIMIVSDATTDNRFADNPLVTGEPWIRFYAGVPIVTPDGYRVGTVCTIDSRPRELDESQIGALKALGRMAAALLERRLDAKHEQLRLLIQHAPDGVVVCRPDGTIVETNPRFRRLFGGTSDNALDLLGRQQDVALLLDDVVRTGTADTLTDVAVCSADGRTFPAEIVAVPIGGNGQGLLHLSIRDVTRRTERDQAQRRTMDFLRQILDGSPAIAYAKDAAGRFVFVNGAFEELSGLSGPDLLGRTGTQLFGDVASRSERIEQRVIATGQAETGDELVPVGGDIRHFRAHRFPIAFDGGLAVATVALDITDLQERIWSSRQSDEEFRSMLDSIEDHVWLVDTSLRRVTYSNKAYERLYGEPIGELYEDPRAFLKRVHPDDREMILRVAYSGSSDPQEHEFRVERPDGSLRWLRSRVFPIEDANGRIVRIGGITEDVTDSMAARTELARLGERSSEVRERMDEAFLELDNDWRCRSMNLHAATMLATTSDALIGKRLWKERPDLVGQPLYDACVRSAETGEPASLQLLLSQRWYECRIFPADDGLSVYAKEITHLRAAEGKLVELERYLDLANLFVRDPEDRIVFWSKASEALYGYSAEEAIGRVSHELLETQFSVPHELIDSELKESGRWDGTLIHKHRDGRPVVVASHWVEHRDPAGRRSAVVQLNTDITKLVSAEAERESLRERLVHAERLDAVGRLAGGIAHDFNNLLAVILNNLDFAIEAVPDETQAGKDLQEVRRAAERAAGLTHQLLVFARRGMVEVGPFDLPGMMDEMIWMLRRLVGDHITLETQIAEGLPLVTADRSQIEQVLLNLVVNARDAMPGGGTIRIEIARGDGSDVVLRVTDDGSGMSPEVAARAVEPFFTTKAVGQGTGLGLSTAYGAVLQANGSFHIDSEAGVGTTVTITLPGTEEVASAPLVTAAAAEAPTGIGVLVVEDDEAVRRVARRILEREGFHISEAADSIEAMRAYERSGGGISVVLTDVRLGGTSGVELIQRMQDRWPHLRFVAMTGFPEEMETLEGIEILHKPFAAADLCDAIARATAKNR